MEFRALPAYWALTWEAWGQGGGKGAEEEEEGGGAVDSRVHEKSLEGTGRDDSGAAGQARGLLLPAVLQCGPQLMSCMCARTCGIIDYRRPVTYLF